MVTDPIKFVYTVGDGVTTDFSYAYNGTVGFDADVAEDVRAAILNPDGTRDTNPNFAVLKDTYGNFTGAIRFAIAPVANAVVYIYRATPQTQETEYETSSGFDAKVVEENFDKITKILQEISLHAKNKTVQLDPFQEQKIALELLSASNNGQYLILDAINWVIKAGLFLEITSDNRFRVSKDGKVWIYLPKSENIQEIRQREYIDKKSIRHLVFEYRVGDQWFNIFSGGYHNEIGGRDEADCHPISAITQLQETLDKKIEKPDGITEVVSDITVSQTADGIELKNRYFFANGKPGATESVVFQKATATQDGLMTKEQAEDLGKKADKTEVDTALAEKADKATTYTKTEVDTALSAKADASALTAETARATNAESALSDRITANSDDIAQLETEVAGKASASEVNTIKTDLADLGDQVHGIEKKIPEKASATNQLATMDDIQQAGGLSAVAHDTTLTGTGTNATPLGVADGAIGNTQLAEEVKDNIDNRTLTYIED